MKTQLVVAPHLVLPGQTVVEIWYSGELIGTVAGADGPGVRVISKHDMIALGPDMQVPSVVEVRIKS